MKQPALAATLLLIFCSHLASAQFGGGSDHLGDMRRQRYNLMQYRKAKAEGSNLKRWWKGESSVGVVYSSPAQFTERSKYTAVDGIQQESYDTTISGQALSLPGLHVNGNTNAMLVRLERGSIISFSWGINFDLLRWDVNNWNGNTRTTSPMSMLQGQLGIPLTLDFKSGADVDFEPERRLCFAAGGGFVPMGGFSVTESNNQAQLKFRMPPYVYASVGFYAGVCWKIRASFIPGTFSVFTDSETNFAGTINTFSATGSNVFSVGIGLMSFSQDWHDGGGWRVGQKGGRY